MTAVQITLWYLSNFSFYLGKNKKQFYVVFFFFLMQILWLSAEMIWRFN